MIGYNYEPEKNEFNCIYLTLSDIWRQSSYDESGTHNRIRTL